MQVMYFFIFLFLCALSSESKDGALSLSIALRSSDKRENLRRFWITVGLKDLQLKQDLELSLKTNKKKTTCLKVYFSGTIWKIMKAKEQLPVEITTMIKRNCTCS